MSKADPVIQAVYKETDIMSSELRCMLFTFQVKMIIFLDLQEKCLKYVDNTDKNP